MTHPTDIELIIPGREKDLGGGFQVRRVLPFAKHRMVGPFIFFDHMGPVEITPGTGMDVRPHPHVNLATVTYLFEGIVRHRDSLGSDIIIEPGAINWMTAGRGIVHSERTPESHLNRNFRMDGIQLWVALPTEHEEVEPSFSHHAKETLPEFNIGKAQLKLLLGTAFGKQSPVPVLSDLFYIQLQLPKTEKFILSSNERESAAYIVKGAALVDGKPLSRFEMAVGKGTEDLEIEATEDSLIMLIGGKPVGERFIYWNFVSSSKERLEEAKADWANGPLSTNKRFFPVPTDSQEYIPLPKI